MSSFEISVNGRKHQVEIEGDTPLLWLLRDTLGLVGTKFGCGIGQCGACTVHLNGAPVRACLMPVMACAGQQITTIEGLAEEGKLTPLQEAWCEHDVAQCGYCQSGQIMSAAALLKTNPKPSDADIDAAMGGNFCRCATYTRIRQAIHTAAAR
jgi:isoquinoline 1-oxidoreductase subunit alpha